MMGTSPRSCCSRRGSIIAHRARSDSAGLAVEEDDTGSPSFWHEKAATAIAIAKTNFRMRKTNRFLFMAHPPCCQQYFDPGFALRLHCVPFLVIAWHRPGVCVAGVEGITSDLVVGCAICF